MKNLYLCGFMGCGKSHMGRMLSERLHCTLVDLDAYIEEKEGMTIPEIFEKYGEQAFRDMEHEACVELSKQKNLVIGLIIHLPLCHQGHFGFGVKMALKSPTFIMRERSGVTSPRYGKGPRAARAQFQTRFIKFQP